MREAFESALRDNPDDLAGWCAYADWLAEQGDPRGEFMQTQIALEDESRPKEERDVLKKRERKLLAAHQRAWLGALAPFVLDQQSRFPDTEVQFRRGWLSEVSSREFSVDMVRALGRAPEAQFVSRLLVRNTRDEYPRGADDESGEWLYEPGPDVPPGLDEYDRPALYALRECPRLARVRAFGCGGGATEPGSGLEGGSGTYASVVHEVVARMPNLEELYLYTYSLNADALFALPLPNLRVLRVDHETAYPLDVLAANPSLGRLTHLLCQPHAQRPRDPDAYIRLPQLRALCRSPHLASLQHLRLLLTDFGDEGAEEIVSSGVLKRLKVLDLSYGCITDAGAALLAACPDLKNLLLLDLTMNALTPKGIETLTATGVPLKTDAQHDEYPGKIGSPGWLEYLSTHGDIE